MNTFFFPNAFISIFYIFIRHILVWSPYNQSSFILFSIFYNNYYCSTYFIHNLHQLQLRLFYKDSARGCRALTRYQVRNILARLCYAPDDSQPLGALVSMHPFLSCPAGRFSLLIHFTFAVMLLSLTSTFQSDSFNYKEL